MASIRTASRYWSTLVLLVSIGLIGGFAYYVHQQVGLGQVLSLPLDRLSPLLAGFAALLSFLSLLWVLVLLEFRNTDEKHPRRCDQGGAGAADRAGHRGGAACRPYRLRPAQPGRRAKGVDHRSGAGAGHHRHPVPPAFQGRRGFRRQAHGGGEPDQGRDRRANRRSHLHVAEYGRPARQPGGGGEEGNQRPRRSAESLRPGHRLNRARPWRAAFRPRRPGQFPGRVAANRDQAAGRTAQELRRQADRRFRRRHRCPQQAHRSGDPRQPPPAAIRCRRQSRRNPAC